MRQMGWLAALDGGLKVLATDRRGSVEFCRHGRVHAGGDRDNKPARVNRWNPGTAPFIDGRSFGVAVGSC